MNMTIFDYNMSLLSKEKKYYILGCDDSARQFAIRLLNSGVYFHGFVVLNNVLEQGCRLWNKPVIDIQECLECSDIMIITSYISYLQDKEVLKKYRLDAKLIKFEILKPCITDASGVVIYGTGSQGEEIFQACSDLMNVCYFSNSNENRWGNYFCGRKIISPQEITNLPDDTVIIIASNAYQKIHESLLEFHIEDDRIYCLENGALRFCQSYIIENSFLISKLMFLLQNNKNMVLYGEEAIVEKIREKFELLDFYNIETIGRKSKEEDGSLFQLLYFDWKEKICLLADDMNIRSMELIDKIGIPVKNIYWLKNCDEYQKYDHIKKYKYVADPTLGYSAVVLAKGEEGEEEYSGFVKYEYKDDSNKICTILTLGGSTTQSFFVREPTWSECLSRILTKKKIPHRILCGGIGGYSNIQEFLKLTRDGIMLQPDIVLSYSGVNNTNWLMDEEYPFIHRYQRAIFDKLKVKRHIKVGVDDISLSASVNYGIKDQEYNPFQFWLMYERLMNSVCKELSITFKAYLQPILFSKPVFDEYDQELLLGMFGITAKTSEDMYQYAEDITQKYSRDVKNALLFREEVKEYSNIYPDWLVDFSHIMDNKEKVYMDEAHVYECGNEIIAECIYESISHDITKLSHIDNCVRRE